MSLTIGRNAEWSNTIIVSRSVPCSFFVVDEWRNVRQASLMDAISFSWAGQWHFEPPPVSCLRKFAVISSLISRHMQSNHPPEGSTFALAGFRKIWIKIDSFTFKSPIHYRNWSDFRTAFELRLRKILNSFLWNANEKLYISFDRN